MATKSIRILAGILLPALLAPVAAAHDIVRRSESELPMASSVRVPAGADWVLVGATLPRVTNPAAPAGSAERLGDTAAQAASVLDQVADELASQGFAMRDVVKLTVYLVADPALDGAVDYAGLMSAYLRHFGKDDGGLPARTTVEVAGLPVPGVLVAMEAIAARSGDHSHD